MGMTPGSIGRIFLLQGAPLLGLTSPDDYATRDGLAQAESPLRNCFITGREEEWAERKADGRIFEVRAFPIIDDNGGVTSVIRWASDITEKVRMREETLQSSRLASLGELAAGVAHEINNPMAVIRGNVELLQMSVPIEADNREEVDTIFQQVGRVERIVSNLLKFARQEQKHVGAVAINRLLHEILSQVGHQVSLAGIAIEEQFSTELLEITGDSDQLRQVFTNLMVNAVQAMGNGGTLTLATRLLGPKEGVEIAVGDTGTGIAPENREKIFSPFFTTKANGTGLGLSVSYGIVREHGGQINLQSEPGKGSAFMVILPLGTSRS